MAEKDQFNCGDHRVREMPHWHKISKGNSMWCDGRATVKQGKGKR